MKSSLIAVSLLVLTFALVAPKSLLAADAGADAFKAKCAMCHGPNGDAASPMAKKLAVKPLSDPEVQKLGESGITNVIEKGKGKMKPVSSLTPEQVKAVTAYVLSLK